MKWLYQTAGPFLICFQKVHIVFIAVVPTDIPQTEHDGSLLFTFHSIRFISYLFDDRHFVAYEVVAFHCHLIWISLMISDAEHFFKCLLIICMFSLGKKKKGLFWSDGQFLIKLLVFSMSRCILSLNILDINPLLDTLFSKIFCHSVGCHSFGLIVSLAVQTKRFLI